MSGELGKLTFYPFKDEEFNTKNGDPFVVPINPEQFSRSFKIEWDEQQAQGSEGLDAKYKNTKSQNLSLDFTFDGTGVVPVKESPGTFHKDVSGLVADFLEVAYNMDPDTHKPNFLKIIWGTMIFQGVLTECQVSYPLFDADGTPLRAKLSTKFLGSIEQNLRVKKEGKKSPDITHIRKVIEGNNLPLMAHRIYGDPTYYLEVARVNDLTNFRRIAANTDIFFPPVDKTAK